MRKTMLMAAGVAMIGLSQIPETAHATTNPYFCIFPTGETRIVWEDEPLARWEKCARRIEVLYEGFTTIELTFGLSAFYDRESKRFSNIRAGGTSEFIKPGEQLFVLDAKLKNRHLVYSQASQSYRFANLIDIETKLITRAELSLLKSNFSADQIFISVEAPTDYYKDKELTQKGKIGQGRFFAWRSNKFDGEGNEFVKVECIKPKKCQGSVGWIPKTSLAEIVDYEWPAIPFPVIYEFPTRRKIKSCGVQTKTTRTDEIKANISAKVPFANLVGSELGASIEAALKKTREDTYGKDVRIERTIFTVFKFREPRFWEGGRWYPKKPRVLIVDRYTQNCNTSNAMTHFEITTNDGQFQVTDPVANAEIESSAAYTKFVTQAMASLKGRVKGWALNHIASALSAQRR